MHFSSFAAACSVCGARTRPGNATCCHQHWTGNGHGILRQWLECVHASSYLLLSVTYCDQQCSAAPLRCHPHVAHYPAWPTSPWPGLPMRFEFNIETGNYGHIQRSNESPLVLYRTKTGQQMPVLCFSCTTRPNPFDCMYNPGQPRHPVRSWQYMLASCCCGRDKPCLCAYATMGGARTTTLAGAKRRRPSCMRTREDATT